MKISIIVPCYEEANNIRAFYKAMTDVLGQENDEYEFVFINDGSKDQTIHVIREIAQQDHKVKYISFSRNFGKEAAMLAGLSYATGDGAIIMDADLQHPPELVPQLVAGFREGYDQVIARRTRKGDDLGRTIMSRLYYKIMNKMLDIQLVDGIGDFRFLSRRAIQSILKLKEYNRFSKGLFSWIGFKEKIIDYDNIVRLEGESKWSFGKLVNYGFDGMISFNNKPLRVSIYLGIGVTIFAVAYVIFSFIKSLIYGIDVPGYFTLISSFLLVGGLQLIFMGVIGEYIGRIYYETKRRPHYLIEDQNMEHGAVRENVDEDL